MDKKLAQIISYVFHPLLMTTYLVCLLFLFSPSILQPLSAEHFLPITLMIFILTYLIPAVSIGLLKLTKSISSIKLEERRERIMPFIFVSLYYGLTTYLFASKLLLGDLLVAMFGAVTLIIFIIALTNIWFKISAHAVGSWGMVGFLVAIHFKFPDSQLLWPICGALIISGLISSSRLLLNTHNISEIYAGALTGFGISFGTILIMT